AAQALALPRSARGPRLRAAGRRESSCSPGAGAPAHAAARAVGAGGAGGQRRRGSARRSADAAHRGARALTRAALPKLRASPALAAAGLLAAVVLGRPELVSLAVPSALFLAVGVSRLSAPDVTIALELDRRRIAEGDDASLAVEASSTSGVHR